MKVRATQAGFLGKGVQAKRIREGTEFDYPDSQMKLKEVELNGKKATLKVLPKWVEPIGELPAGYTFADRKGRRRVVRPVDVKPVKAEPVKGESPSKEKSGGADLVR